MTGGQVSA